MSVERFRPSETSGRGNLVHEEDEGVHSDEHTVNEG